MKTKIILTISVAFILSSCKKNYTCSCFNPSGVFKTYEIKDTKRKATQKCNEYSKEYQDIPWSETGCALK